MRGDCYVRSHQPNNVACSGIVGLARDLLPDRDAGRLPEDQDRIRSDGSFDKSRGLRLSARQDSRGFNQGDISRSNERLRETVSDVRR